MECILHIGTEKTGTTSIQDWLYQNELELSRRGVAISGSIGRPNNRKLVAFYQSQYDDFFQDRSINNKEEKNLFFSGFIESFRAEVEQKKRDHEKFVISSEHFHSRLRDIAEIRNLHAFLREIFDGIRVVCYFREQSDLNRSLYSTAIRAGSAVSFGEFSANISVDDHYYNYEVMFGKWASVFGDANVKAKLFAKRELDDGDIRRDFARECGSKLNLNVFSFESRRSNEALTGLQCFFGRVVNAAIPRYDENRRVNHLRTEVLDNVLNSSMLRAAKPLLSTRSGDIYRLFHASNTRWSQRYLGFDGNPFEMPDGIENSDSTMDCFSSDDALIAFRFLVSQVERINRSPFVGSPGAATLVNLAERRSPDFQ